MRRRLERIKWNVVAPLALLAIALLLVAWFTLSVDSDAEPAPPLGKIGTPVRGTFVPATSTPIGAKPKATPRPTVTGVQGTREERDGRRRSDLLILVDGFRRLRDSEGSFPTTKGNVQTLCAFEELDVGCALKQVLGPALPKDPLNNPVESGYWYSSDGDTLKLYASLELDVPDDQLCETKDANLQAKPNLVCLSYP